MQCESRSQRGDRDRSAGLVVAASGGGQQRERAESARAGGEWGIRAEAGSSHDAFRPFMGDSSGDALRGVNKRGERWREQEAGARRCEETLIGRSAGSL